MNAFEHDHAPPSAPLAPEWATRGLLTFIVLSLAALIVIPWATARHLQPIQHEMNQLADPGRGLVTRLHLYMAQEREALDDYIDQRDSLSRHHFELAASGSRTANAQLAPIVAELGAEPRRRMEALLELEERWHQSVDSGVWNRPRDAELRHDPAREDLYDDLLIAAANLDEAISQAGRDRRTRISEIESIQQSTSALLGLLALAAAAATWRLSQRVRRYALDAEERRAALAEALSARARLMRGVSHDLKNPIHAIDGHAQLLEEGMRGPLTPEQRDSVARIRRSAHSMTGLITDLLELARAEAGQLTVRLDQVVLRDVVRDSVEEHRAAAEFAGLTLVMSCDDADVAVTTDPARVSQVLGNLISNAIKYTPAGGHVEVAAELLNRRAEDGAASRLAIHVADTGPGIPAAKREEIFGEFTRLVADENKPGAGLGLSIARRVARLLGGDI
ncbi:MAG TPA: HAMP domain-containing sensor histidine kinase, partial [Gemmatimonadaceae bacterium]|nr:HAMP domain-containing sensor histidine kinase [Gemmatimonadaceae bacterium]